MAVSISATDLGYYASSRFCPCCAWVKFHVKNLPFQSFPGIFSTIDRYNKLVVRKYFNRENALPSWLGKLGPVQICIDPPHWSKFQVLDSASGVTLRGEADGIFRMADDSYTIVDYKTSKFSNAQRAMMRSYETQLNAYAYIGERLNVSPVGKLALVYMEPLTGEEAVVDPAMVDAKGFSMCFEAMVVEVELKPEKLIPPLLARVQEVAGMEAAPAGYPGCKDCEALDGLIDTLTRPH